MSAFGYIFLAQNIDYRVPAAEQQRALLEYAGSIGLSITRIFVEDASVMQQPFLDRPEANELQRQCQPGDSILIMKAEWILGSAVDGYHLLSVLAEKNIALHCVDLGANISIAEKRRLEVSEGCADLVKKLLAALSVCETSRQGQAIRIAKRRGREQGKYLGGPVPFGWKVDGEGVLVQNETQQNIIREIEAMRAARWSYREISVHLREKFDVRLSHEGVRKILLYNAQKQLTDVKVSKTKR